MTAAPAAAAGRPRVALWVGGVLLAKGIPYLLEAARSLQGEALRFVVAGPIGVAREALAAAPPNVTFLGKVNRAAVHDLYRSADLFVFPTLSDGFGMTQLEAMSHGLPVVTTPRCGEVVTPGEDGLVVPAADAAALAAAVQGLARDDDRRRAMGARARAKAAGFTLAAYAARLAALIPGKGGGARRWIVAQIGAREHYAVARALRRAGALRALYTEAWCRLGAGALRRLPGPLGALGGRHHPDLDGAAVRAQTARSLLRELRERGARGAWSNADLFLRHVALGKEFAGWVADGLLAEGVDPARDAYFGYTTGALETVRLLRDRGVPCVVDQIDAGRVHWDIVRVESERWPGWQPRPAPIPEAFWERLSAEWAAADAVVVNSPWTRDALVAQGVPREKLCIIPLAFEAAE